MRTRRAILNFLSDSISQVIIALIGLYKVKLFLSVLGEETLGIYQLYGQILAYLAIAEAGVTNAVLRRLYKPIAEHDDNKINEILSGAKVIFSVIGLLIMLVGIIISFKINFFIKQTTIDSSYIQYAFILFLLSNIINYFTVSHKILFDAEQKAYIPNLIFQIGAITKGIVEIIILTLGLGLIEILIMFAIVTIIYNLILVYISRKKHNNLNLKTKKDYSALTDTRHLFVHKIGTLIAFNIDIIIISKILGLGSVVIYSAYSYITENLRNIISKINNATLAGIGNLLYTEKEKAYSVYLEYNSFVFFLATIICVPLYLVINNFIMIWYSGEIAATNNLAILFSLLLFYNIIRQPLNVYTSGAGLFKETKICTIIESILNLSLSLLFVYIIGIEGVLIATFISYIISEFLLKPIILDRKLFHVGVRQFYLNSLLYVIFVVILAIIGQFIVNLFTINNIIIWFITSCIVFLIIFVLTVALYKIFGHSKFFDRIINLIRSGKHVQN